MGISKNTALNAMFLGAPHCGQRYSSWACRRRTIIRKKWEYMYIPDLRMYCVWFTLRGGSLLFE